jgi:hypothetical protein
MDAAGSDVPSPTDAASADARDDSEASVCERALTGAAALDRTLGAWGAPRRIVALTSPGNDDDPTLTGDMLELYFNSDRAGGLGRGDIWRSTRATIADTWSAPTLVTELSSASVETTPEVSRDGLTLWFGSDRSGGAGRQDVWVSTRASRGAAWATPVVVSELSSAATDNAATESRGGLRLILSSDRGTDAGVNALLASSRATVTAPWAMPVRLAEFGASRNTSSPLESDDGTLVYFNQTDAGRDHLYRATRADERCAYSAMTAIAELNSPATDADPWFSPDLRRVVFSSTRDGDPEIYESAR